MPPRSSVTRFLASTFPLGQSFSHLGTTPQMPAVHSTVNNLTGLHTAPALYQDRESRSASQYQALPPLPVPTDTPPPPPAFRAQRENDPCRKAAPSQT